MIGHILVPFFETYFNSHLTSLYQFFNKKESKLVMKLE